MSEQVPAAPRKGRNRVIGMLPKQGIGAEIGVWKGEFSVEILRGADPRLLYLIDPWIKRDDDTHRASWYGTQRHHDMERIYEDVRLMFERECECGKVVIKRGASQEILKEFPDDYFDFVYIDGDHEYSAVRQDCFLAFQKVRPGGFICGDDYLIDGWWKDGVVKAFHELIADKDLLIKYVRGSQIVLQKRR